MNEQDRPPRAVNIAIVERRQVRDAIAKVALGIEELQREAAVLSAMAKHRPLEPTSDATPLRTRVKTAKTRLDRAVAKLPEHLQDHGRITDLRKAIASLEVLLPGADS